MISPVRKAALALAALATAAIGFFTLPGDREAPGSLVAQAPYPTPQQCFAKFRTKHKEGSVFYSPCGGDTRWCPDHGPGVPLCIPKSPAELAEEKRQAEAREAQARAAAAEKARFEAQVEAEKARLGAHREAEIRRKLELRNRAQAARPDPVARRCTTSTQARQGSWSGQNRQAATDAAIKGMPNICPAQNSVSALSCVLDKPVVLPKPPIGDCLACISEKQAAALGWTAAGGWPKPSESWTCSATAQCRVEKCDGAAGATRK